MESKAREGISKMAAALKLIVKVDATKMSFCNYRGFTLVAMKVFPSVNSERNNAFSV